MPQSEAIRALVDAALRPAGLVVWDVETAGDLVRVLVDRDGGVDLDALDTASAAVSALLDEHDELVPSGAYHLEVSSPGIERTLRSREHFARSLGSTVSVKTVAGVDPRRLKGVLTGADDTGIAVRDEDRAGEVRHLAYGQLDRVRTVLDWGPRSQPARGGRAAAPRSPAARPVPTPSASSSKDASR